MSNLAVIQSIRQSKQTNMENSDQQKLSSAQRTIESCVKNSQLLKDRIDNTIELVRLLNNETLRSSHWGSRSNDDADQLYFDDPQP